MLNLGTKTKTNAIRIVLNFGLIGALDFFRIFRQKQICFAYDHVRIADLEGLELC